MHWHGRAITRDSPGRPATSRGPPAHAPPADSSALAQRFSLPMAPSLPRGDGASALQEDKALRSSRHWTEWTPAAKSREPWAHVCVCTNVFIHLLMITCVTGEQGPGKIRNRHIWITELYLAFSSQMKSHPKLVGHTPIPRERGLRSIFLNGSSERLQRRRKLRVRP